MNPNLISKGYPYKNMKLAERFKVMILNGSYTEHLPGIENGKTEELTLEEGHIIMVVEMDCGLKVFLADIKGLKEYLDVSGSIEEKDLLPDVCDPNMVSSITLRALETKRKVILCKPPGSFQTTILDEMYEFFCAREKIELLAKPD